MRTRKRMRRELALRERVDRMQHETGDHLSGWGWYAHRRNLREIEKLRNAVRPPSETP